MYVIEMSAGRCELCVCEYESACVGHAGIYTGPWTVDMNSIGEY